MEALGGAEFAGSIMGVLDMRLLVGFDRAYCLHKMVVNGRIAIRPTIVFLFYILL